MAAGTVTYVYPVSGTVAPTAAQAAQVNLVSAQVAFNAADTTATVTHNFGLAAGAPASLNPIVIITPATGGSVSPNVSVSLTNTNAVVLTKNSVDANTTTTVNVWVMRPFSMIT